MARFYVYSTLTNDYAYTNFEPVTINGQPRQIKRSSDGFKEQILIKGGANIPNDHFITPLGVRTEITERQYAALQDNRTFQKHLKQGLILVKSEKDDPEAVARAYMLARDQSAPLTPQSDVFKKDDPESVKPSETLGGRIGAAVKNLF